MDDSAWNGDLCVDECQLGIARIILFYCGINELSLIDSKYGLPA